VLFGCRVVPESDLDASIARRAAMGMRKFGPMRGNVAPRAAPGCSLPLREGARRTACAMTVGRRGRRRSVGRARVRPRGRPDDDAATGRATHAPRRALVGLGVDDAAPAPGALERRPAGRGAGGGAARCRAAGRGTAGHRADTWSAAGHLGRSRSGRPAVAATATAGQEVVGPGDRHRPCRARRGGRSWRGRDPRVPAPRVHALSRRNVWDADGAADDSTRRVVAAGHGTDARADGPARNARRVGTALAPRIPGPAAAPQGRHRGTTANGDRVVEPGTCLHRRL
jgi:hypothetical protein